MVPMRDGRVEVALVCEHFDCIVVRGGLCGWAGQPAFAHTADGGLHILKYSENLSDERLCEIWAENPYFQYFCGEEFFQHKLVFDRSSAVNF